MDEVNKESKTEKPTSKKMQDALKQGKVIVSKEVYNVFIIFGIFCIVSFIIPSTSEYSLRYLRGLIEFCWDSNLIYGSFAVVTKKIFFNIALLFLIPIFALLIILVIIAHFIHHGKFVNNFDKISIDFNRLSPVLGFKKLFSKTNIYEMVKHIFKLVIIILGFIYVINKDLSYIVNSASTEIHNLLIVFFNLLKSIILCILLFKIVVALLDYLYYRHQYIKSLMMSKQEIKDELKETEGNPQIKSNIRLKRQKFYSKMLYSVNRSSLLITSDNNIVVGLEYIEDKSLAPVVIAKGKGITALQLKNVAFMSSIPIMTNNELALGIYNNANLYDQIPSYYFKDVAKIIAYLMSNK